MYLCCLWRRLRLLPAFPRGVLVPLEPRVVHSHSLTERACKICACESTQVCRKSRLSLSQTNLDIADLESQRVNASLPMASDQTVTAAPTTTVIRQSPSALPYNTTASLPDPDTSKSKSLKRGRSEHSQNPINSTSVANTRLGGSPSSKSPRLKGPFASGVSVVQPTGAAALADEQRKRGETQKRPTAPMTEAQGYKSGSTTMGGGYDTSRPEDTPGATSVVGDGVRATANAITNPNVMQSDEKSEMSPASATSLASLGSPGQTVTASPTMVASPGPMTGEAEIREPRPAAGSQLQAPTEDFTPHRGALSYPGSMLAPSGPPRPSRGLSLPMPSQNLAPRSPSQKKYKCQYCNTEFTRHHNLKSHLLTHSHEKPFVCQTCNLRFRRLHDLKRHMKLHTGERPHVCPKCDRKFARGDALARHTKGQGGCAGRRASMGSYAGDEDMEDSQAGEAGDNEMDGIMYNGSRPNEADMTEEERRRYSLPTIRAQHVSGSHDNYTQRTPSTYPPAGPRPVPQVQSTGGLYPPNTDRGGGLTNSGNSSSLQNSTASPHSPGGNLSFSSGGNSIYIASGGIIESPRPLSPGAMAAHQLGQDPSLARQRSPSMNTQYQQQQFAHRQSDRASPTSMSLPSPHPKLPVLHGLGLPEQRYNMPGQTPNQSGTTNGSQATATSPSTAYPPPLGSTSGRSAPVGAHQQGNESGDSSNNLFANGGRDLAAYCQRMEEQVKQLSEQVRAMEAEKISNRDHVSRQQEQINQLQKELLSLRGNMGNQGLPERLPASGSS